MNALLLPGNSPRHGVWVENLKNALGTTCEDITTQHYRHWSTGDKSADIDYEISVAHQGTLGLDPYVIIAKSIGTVIAVKGSAEGKLKPKKLILLGVPVNGGITKELFSAYLQAVDVEVVVVQNTKDPLGAFSDVKGAFTGSSKSIVFVELPSDTHDYLDFDAIKKLI